MGIEYRVRVSAAMTARWRWWVWCGCGGGMFHVSLAEWGVSTPLLPDFARGVCVCVRSPSFFFLSLSPSSKDI